MQRYKKQSVKKKKKKKEERHGNLWKIRETIVELERIGEAFDLQANIHRERSFNLTRSLIGNEQYANDVSINKLKK